MLVVATMEPSRYSVIPATATLSVAVAPMVSLVPEIVAPFAGLVILTVGGVVSVVTDPTVCCRTGLVEAAFETSPLYEATTLLVPAARLDDAQLAAPLASVAVQSAAPFAVNFTVPVGAFPVTLAVKVTLLPTVAGLMEVVSAVEVEAWEADDETCTVAPEGPAAMTVTLMP